MTQPQYVFDMQYTSPYGLPEPLCDNCVKQSCVTVQDCGYETIQSSAIKRQARCWANSGSKLTLEAEGKNAPTNHSQWLFYVYTTVLVPSNIFPPHRTVHSQLKTLRSKPSSYVTRLCEAHLLWSLYHL